MSGTSHDIQCGLCGHRHPVSRFRARGYIDCACGMRLEAPPRPRTRHRLAGVLVVVATIAALGGVAWFWARGLG